MKTVARNNETEICFSKYDFPVYYFLLTPTTYISVVFVSLIDTSLLKTLMNLFLIQRSLSY